mmetsp:Transcript_10225/g.31229  ORF Transcript_10225/g.31229 Transcript_10225/m.31229 type:complete len:160 (-) Transcript_10225:406-885(-)
MLLWQQITKMIPWCAKQKAPLDGAAAKAISCQDSQLFSPHGAIWRNRTAEMSKIGTTSAFHTNISISSSQRDRSRAVSRANSQEAADLATRSKIFTSYPSSVFRRIAAYAASYLTRASAKAAFAELKRSVLTSDLLARVGEQFEELYPANSDDDGGAGR